MVLSTKYSIEPTQNDILENEIINHLNDLTKPVGSLGRLEDFALKYCLCRGSAASNIKNMEMYTFAGDHGITAEGVCPYPSEVTAQMVLNMVHGGAAISVLCKNSGINCFVVDVGVKSDIPSMPGLIINKIAHGTKSFLNQSAMTESECQNALDAGISLAQKSNADLCGIGEMGIGNSSSASALYALLLEKSAQETVGAGTGSVGAKLQKKIAVITQALEFHRKLWNNSPFDALCRVGGLEIAAMTGFMLGTASKRIPVVVDGFIAGAAALVAMKIEPIVRDYLFFSHCSAEKFHIQFFVNEEIRPILNLDMRLGEGTGAALAMHVISQAMHCYNEMATFSSASVSKSNQNK